MKVAICSDIHSNLPALENFINETSDVDQRWCLGDITGYGPWPKECLDIVRDKFDVVIKGNHDRELSNNNINKEYNPREKRWMIGEDEKYSTFNYMATEALSYAANKLDPEDFNYLYSLDESLTFEKNNYKFKVAHSHPSEKDKYVYPCDFKNVKDELHDCDYLFLGHTHKPNIEKFEEGVVMNPGSLGQPRDGDPRSSYAIFENGKINLKRSGYNLGEYVDKIRKVGLPKELGERVCSGR